MRTAVVIVVLFLAALAQATVFPYIAVANVKPDLVLLMVVSWGILRGPREGLLWGAVGGLWLDSFTVMPFGVSTIVLAAIGFVSGYGRTEGPTDNVTSMGVAALATVVFDIIAMGSWLLLGWRGDFIGTLTVVTLPSAVVNALLMFVVFRVLGSFVPRSRTASQTYW